MRSVMTTSLDSDERLHSEVGLKGKGQGNVRVRIRERSGERLQRRTQRKRQLRTVESADDSYKGEENATVDREAADDRLTSATEKTTRGSD